MTPEMVMSMSIDEPMTVCSAGSRRWVHGDDATDPPEREVLVSQAASPLHTLRPLRRRLLDADVGNKIISVLLLTAAVLAVILAAVRA